MRIYGFSHWIVGCLCVCVCVCAVPKLIASGFVSVSLSFSLSFFRLFFRRFFLSFFANEIMPVPFLISPVNKHEGDAHWKCIFFGNRWNIMWDIDRLNVVNRNHKQTKAKATDENERYTQHTDMYTVQTVDKWEEWASTSELWSAQIGQRQKSAVKLKSPKC